MSSSRVSGLAVGAGAAFFGAWGMSHTPAPTPDPPAPPLRFGYWAIRGLAQPFRVLCDYGQVKYVPITYAQGGPEANYDKSKWFNVKEHLGLPFPNLPYLLDGELKLTQSNAILRHVARKIDGTLLGRSAAEMAVVDMLLDEAMDTRLNINRVLYRNYDNDNARQTLQTVTIPKRLAKFEAFVAEHGGPYLLRSGLTVADFVLHDVCDIAERAAPGTLVKYPHLVTLCKTFEALPGVAKSLSESPDIPLNNRHAKFGSEPQPLGVTMMVPKEG